MPAELKKHPSLTAPFDHPRPLKPVQTMGRNERCWCGSGAKWKKCHKNRHLMEAIDFPRALHQLNQTMKDEGFCSHPAAGAETCGKLIRSHTIQRSGGLSSIAENGHVLSFLKGYKNIDRKRNKLAPELVGLRDAATFRGFCDKHDASMFRSVEHGEVKLDKESAFLLSFRAMAYEHYTKTAAVRGFPLQRQLDRGKSFSEQCRIQGLFQHFEFGNKRGLRDAQEWKAEYDAAYSHRKYDDFGFLCVLLDDVLPVTACGGIFPEVDFSGEALQDIGSGAARPEDVTFNLTVLNGRSVAVFGWTDSEYDVLERFISSFCSLDDEAKADALVRFSFEFIENTFCDPRWWEALSDEVRDAIEQRVRTGAALTLERQPDCLLSDGHVLVGPRKIVDTYIL